jgi:RNA polymerase sigma-70 factor (ECF subfamily)
MLLDRTPSTHAPAGSDRDLTAQVQAGDQAAFETLMRRYNGRLFRVARAILKDDAEAEDTLQDAYLDAYRHMDAFRGDAGLATWLTRIVVNHALMRLRKQRRQGSVVPFDAYTAARASEDAPPRPDPPDEAAESAPDAVLRAEIRRLIERRIDELPLAFRMVFIMRDVDDMSVAETAASLSIPAATVRTRLFRARGLLREALAKDLDRATVDVFRFGGERCDRIVTGVLATLANDPS